MPELRRFEPEELMHRPGTYFNPSTEVLLVVDDSTTVAADFDGESSDDWVLISDDVPIDEDVRDALIERFASRHGGAAEVLEEDVDVDLDEEEELGQIEEDDEY
jgi:hypothetical protein